MMPKVNCCGADMGYDVKIQRLELNAIIDLQGDAKAIKNWIKDGDLPDFPDKPNTSSTNQNFKLYWVGLEHWLLRSEIELEDRLLEMTNSSAAPIEISLVQVSDAFKFFEVIGPDAAEIISIASPIDHHLSVFPDNGVSYTNIFGIKGLLIRVNNGFEIAVESSYADLMADFLQRANA
jgi:heterotetrameric sarcosine oxidase gamma subunit